MDKQLTDSQILEIAGDFACDAVGKTHLIRIARDIIAESSAALAGVAVASLPTQTWASAAEWLRNNAHAHPNLATICDAMIAAAPQVGTPCANKGRTNEQAAVEVAQPSAVPDRTIEKLRIEAADYGVISKPAAEYFARALLSVQRDTASSAWQPIETAPKDGTHIILTNDTDVSEGRWEHHEAYIQERRDIDGCYIDQDEFDGFTGWVDGGGGMQPGPTRWMPMPMPAARKEGN